MEKLILFQGDSITDWGRDRNNDEGCGNGYPLLVKAALGASHPKEYKFINRGIGGNRIVDLYARIKMDITNLKPDYLSIYIGVNDVWHELADQNGVDTAKFEKIYSMLLDEIKESCPSTKIFLIAPFVLKGCGTSRDDDPSYYERFVIDVASKADVVTKLAAKYSLPCVELQPIFDEACKSAPADYWTIDGVHPTPMGHELIKNIWIDTFNKIK